MKDLYFSNTRGTKCSHIINRGITCSAARCPVQSRGCSLRGEKQLQQRGRNNGKSPCRGSLPQSNTPHAHVTRERPHLLAQSANEATPHRPSAGTRPGTQSTTFKIRVHLREMGLLNSWASILCVP